MKVVLHLLMIFGVYSSFFDLKPHPPLFVSMSLEDEIAFNKVIWFVFDELDPSYLKK